MMLVSHDPEETPMKEFVNCLKQQLSEFDLLKSMYPSHGEITLSDKEVLAEINRFIDGETEFVPNNLEYVLTMVIQNVKLEICVNLPVTYPNEAPDIYIRSNQLNRQQESNLNTELSQYLESNQNGEVCLYTAITWLQDKMDVITKNLDGDHARCIEEDTAVSPQNLRGTRLWIYSHHIYNKKKRERIVRKAKELQLTGFCLPGKPGVICVEGNEKQCKDYWQSIKEMCWKKIMIRKTEYFESNETCDWKKFSYFEELQFRSAVGSRHGVMREFSIFMKSVGFSDMFQDFFGFSE